MKTTKQIYLLMEKKGRELAALAEGLDKIIVTEETLRTMFDGKETDSVNASPILEKGVSIQVRDEIKDYLIFEIMEREGVSFKIHCESYQEYCGKEKKLPESTPLWAYTADISVSFGEEISISAESFDNAFVSVYRKQKLFEKADQYMRENVEPGTQNIIGFIRVMAFINYLSEHPELKEMENKADVGKSRKKPSTDKQTPRKSPHTISLNGIRVISSNETLARKLCSRKRQRLTEAWSVRGHYRHYKSGKTVYIKPYMKGNGKTIPKEYKLS